MNWFLIAAQIFIASAMADVWLIRYNRPGFFRGGSARTMEEEFRVYGLPDWFRNFIRVSKLSAGGLMIAGIWIPLLAVIAGSGLAVLMLGAVAMHFKVGDPLYKALPSTTFLVLSILVAYFQFGRVAAS
jgi:hypothetical protein